jgi:hypothetical protein
LGHFRHKHVLKRMVGIFAMSLAALAALGWLARQPWFYLGLGVTPNLTLQTTPGLGAPNDALALILFMLAAPVVAFFVSPLMALLSRRDEFQADAYAMAQASGADLASALLKLYEDMGWEPVVAPEMEFYIVDVNRDPDLPLQPPLGRTGRPETGRKAYSIDAVNEYDDMFEDIYDYCHAQNLEVDTLIHEIGTAQMEINFLHGNPLDLADQVFLFKRTVREAAFRHGMYATFMAKPMEGEPGSAMHMHQSVIDTASGPSIGLDAPIAWRAIRATVDS